MLELLYNHNSFITHSIQGIAAFTGLFYLKKYKGTAAIFFIGILIYLFLIDTLGGYPKYYNDYDFLEIIKRTKFRSNYWWFTIFFDIIAIVLFNCFYQKILKKRQHLYFLKRINYLYLLFSIILITLYPENLFNANYGALYIIGALVILSCSILYFIEMMESEEILAFYKSLYFYVSVAIFIWWFIVTPLVFYDKYYTLRDMDFIYLKKGIYIFANIFMYLTFAIGLIVSKPEKKA